MKNTTHSNLTGRGLAHLLYAAGQRKAAANSDASGGGRAAKIASTGGGRVVESKAIGPQRTAKMKASTFAHLAPAVFEDADDNGPSATPRPAVAADGILRAAARARTPTGTGAAKPTGLAARIIAAGRKRRGESR